MTNFSALIVEINSTVQKLPDRNGKPGEAPSQPPPHGEEEAA